MLQPNSKVLQEIRSLSFLIGDRNFATIRCHGLKLAVGIDGENDCGASRSRATDTVANHAASQLHAARTRSHTAPTAGRSGNDITPLVGDQAVAGIMALAGECLMVAWWTAQQGPHVMWITRLLRLRGMLAIQSPSAW